MFAPIPPKRLSISSPCTDSAGCISELRLDDRQPRIGPENALSWKNRALRIKDVIDRALTRQLEEAKNLLESEQ